MWNASTERLSYQVDNSQDWDYYGEGDPASTSGYCGGTYASPYCLITEYDIWALPQAADNYDQPGDPEPCDPLTIFSIYAIVRCLRRCRAPSKSARISLAG